MDVEAIRAYCLKKPGTTESFPFDEDTLVFKVLGKMYLLMSLERIPSTMNVKCDPDLAVELREQYEDITPGYHMSKKHWNTIVVEGSFSDAQLTGWIDASYGLVVSKLPKRDRVALEAAIE